MFFSSSLKNHLSLLSTIILFACCIPSFLSAQEFAEESKWDEFLALDEHKTKLTFTITEECTSCFSYFKYVDYLYKHKKDDVEVYVIISKRTGNTSIYKNIKDEFEEYGYSFRYYYMDDGDYENDNFNKNPRTYIVDYTKQVSEVHYEASEEQKEAILRYVKKDAQKTVIEVNKLYLNRNKAFQKKSLKEVIHNMPELETLDQEQLDELLEFEKEKTKIVHFDGAWYGGYKLMLPLIDYLNQHKKEHVEITVILMLNEYKKNNGKYLNSLITWSKEHGILLKYYLVNPNELREKNSSWIGSVPYTYFIRKDGSLLRSVGWGKENREHLLDFVEEDAVKIIDEVRKLYTEEWRETREKITVDGKTYYMVESEIWTLSNAHMSSVSVNKGEVLSITATGQIQYKEKAYSPKGLENGLFKESSSTQSFNHGALLAVILDEDGKNLQLENVGEKLIFHVNKSGKLVLGANTKTHKDNEGHFEGTIKRFVSSD